MKQTTLVWLGVLVLLWAACAPGQVATSVPTVAPQTPVATSAPTPTLSSGATVSPITPTPVPTTSPTAVAKPKYGGVLTTTIKTDPADSGWDPMVVKGGGLGFRETHNLVYAHLAVNNPPWPTVPCLYRLTPSLAEGWRWLNDLTLELKLRQGVRFQNKPPVNGRELTAEDVVYTFNRAVFVEPVRLAEALRPVLTKIEATDRYSVRFYTKQPSPILEYSWLANQYGASMVMAKESADPKGQFSSPASYIGTGPFSLEQWRPGVKLSFKKHTQYFQPNLPYLDGIEYLIVPEASTTLALLRAGRIDLWYRDMPPVTAQEVRKTNPEVDLQGCPLETVAVIPKVTKPPLNDVRLRRALAMAIDRQGLVKSVLLGEGEAVALFGPWYSGFYLSREDLPPEVRQYSEYHPDQARRLLAEAGYAPGKLKVTLTTPPRYGPPYTQLMEAVVAGLTEAGFDVTMNWQEWGAWGLTTNVGKYESLAGSRFLYDDFFRTMARFHSKAEPAENKGSVSDPEMDALVDEFLLTLDRAKLKDLATRIQTRIVDQAYLVMMPAAKMYSAAQPWVRDYAFSGTPNVPYAKLEHVWLAR